MPQPVDVVALRTLRWGTVLAYLGGPGVTPWVLPTGGRGGL